MRESLNRVTPSSVLLEEYELNLSCLYSYELIQVLEGPKPAVKRLFHKRIKKDRRHKDIVTLMEDNSAECKYPEWGMIRATEEDWKLIKQFLPNDEEWASMVAGRNT